MKLFSMFGQYFNFGFSRTEKFYCFQCTLSNPRFNHLTVPSARPRRSSSPVTRQFRSTSRAAVVVVVVVVAVVVVVVDDDDVSGSGSSSSSSS